MFVRLVVMFVPKACAPKHVVLLKCLGEQALTKPCGPSGAFESIRVYHIQYKLKILYPSHRRKFNCMHLYTQ